MANSSENYIINQTPLDNEPSPPLVNESQLSLDNEPPPPFGRETPPLLDNEPPPFGNEPPPLLDNEPPSSLHKIEDVNGARELQSYKRRVWKNVIGLSLTFMMNYTAYYGLFALQSSLHLKQGLGTTCTSIRYVVFSFSSLFLASVLIAVCGHKWTITLSLLSFLLWVAANGFGTWNFMVPASMINGIFDAPLWIGQASYLSELAKQYAAKTCQESGRVSTVFFSVFSAIHSLATIFGNLISTLILKERSATNHTVPTDDEITQHCGFNDCPWMPKNNTNFIKPEEGLVWRLVFVYLGFTLCAVVMSVCLVDSISYNKALKSKDKGRQGGCVSDTVVGVSDEVSCQSHSDRTRLVENDVLDNVHNSSPYAEQRQSYDNTENTERFQNPAVTEIHNRENHTENSGIVANSEISNTDCDTYQNEHQISSQTNDEHEIQPNSDSSIMKNNLNSEADANSESVANQNQTCSQSNIEKEIQSNSERNSIENENSEGDLPEYDTAEDSVAAADSVAVVLRRSLLSSLLLMRHYKLWLLVPLNLYPAFFSSLKNADFTRSWVTCALGMWAVGLVGIPCDAVTTVLAVVTGYFSKVTGRIIIMIISFLIGLALLLVLVFWDIHRDQVWIYFLISAGFGIHQGLFDPIVCAIQGITFPEDTVAVYSCHTFFGCLACVAAYGYSHYLCSDVKIYIVMGSLVAGFAGYFIVDAHNCGANQQQVSE